jgi:hypothetical protein
VTGREQVTVATLRMAAVKAVCAVGNNSVAIKNDGSLGIWGSGSSFPREWPMRQNAPFPVELRISDGAATAAPAG